MSPDTVPSIQPVPYPCSSDQAIETLDTLVQRHVRHAASDIVSPDPEQGCMLDPYIEYLIRGLTSYSTMVDGIVDMTKSDLIGEYVQEKLHSRELDMEFESTHLDNLEDRTKFLNTMKSSLDQARNSISEAWQGRPKAPNNLRAANSGLIERGEFSSHIGRSRTLSNVARILNTPEYDQVRSVEMDHHLESTSPSSDRISQVSEEDSSFTDVDLKILMDGVRTRGKGHHMCPFSTKCTRGGVDKRGKPIIFERNCAFRAHLQKHEKLFKCSLPGCPNKTGFARIDQLQRHKAKVKHDCPNSENEYLKGGSTSPSMIQTHQTTDLQLNLSADDVHEARSGFTHVQIT